MPLIAVERGPEKGMSAKVESGTEVVVGRDPDATLTISDTMSSRKHIRFFLREDGQCVVEDLGSRNGTNLNGDKLEGSQTVAVGDKIEIGETLLSVLEKSQGIKKDKFVGKKIGGYKIIERLGRGGMGTVYLANQLNLDRVVALKILSREWNDPGFVEKFRGEARAAGQLNHPNLIQVYDVGDEKVKNGTLNYFSMEYACGGSVQDLLNEHQKLPLKRALEIVLDAARGLDYAEKKALVHRDIKPDNLMISEGDTVKIGDLGLAQNTDAESEAGKESKIFGTPHFVSPEQIKGEKVDHRADLYSLGATFFRILSGRTPFLGSNVKEIIVKQVREEPPDVREVVPEIPEHISAMITRLMQKDPDKRYQHASELVLDLQAALEGSSEKRHSGATRMRASGVHSTRAQRQKPFPVVLTIVGIVVMLIGLVLVNTFMGGDPEEKPPEKVVTPAPPKDSEDKRKLDAWHLKDDLDARYRGKPPSIEMADAYENAGKKYQGTKPGDEMLNKGKQLHIDYTANRNRLAKELYEKAVQARQSAGNSSKELNDALKLFHKLGITYAETEWGVKAQTAATELNNRIKGVEGEIAAYSSQRKPLEEQIRQLGREKRYAALIKLLEGLRKAFTNPEIVSKLNNEIRNYKRDASATYQRALELAQGFANNKLFDQAVDALAVIYKINIPAMVAEADRRKRQYQTDAQQWRSRKVAEARAADSEAYEQLLDKLAGPNTLGDYRIDRAIATATGAAGTFKTATYQALYNGLMADLAGAKQLLELRRENFGTPIPHSVSPKMQKKWACRPNGQIKGLSLTDRRKAWRINVTVTLRSFNATTRKSLKPQVLGITKVLPMLAGEGRRPSPRHRLGSIGLANLMGYYSWTRTQIQALEQVPKSARESRELATTKQRLAAIRAHVMHEWRRAQDAQKAGRYDEAKRIANRLKERYAGLLR